MHCTRITPEFECQGQRSKFKVTGTKNEKRRHSVPELSSGCGLPSVLHWWENQRMLSSSNYAKHINYSVQSMMLGLHCHQRIIEPPPQLTYAENFAKFGYVVFEMCKQIDRQTHIHSPSSQYFASLPGATNTTTTTLRPFVQDYPGELVPEETLAHSPILIII